jgi:minor extracellular serine protease Vpr
VIRLIRFTLAILIAVSAFSQTPAGRYAVFLADQPLAARYTSRAEMQSAQANSYRQQIEAAQRTVRNELATKNIQVTGSVSTLLNAVFVMAPAGRISELAAIPGVTGVVPLHRRQLLLNRATTLMNGPQAWNISGGFANAGKGMKIGILDTGIDQTHPALQDSSLQTPSGYPICSGSDCAFTSNKVIVARSYIKQLAAGSDPKNPAADSRPDDYSPRDHVGHGTATATSAAGNTATGAVTINGMAPKAYLGNYRVLGSPTVNDGTTDDILVLALQDALNDGMDVVSLSVGGTALTGPLDTGAACGQPVGVPCDVAASAFEAAAQKGLIIVAAAGNSGEDGFNYPTFNSINSPGDAPSVIAAGATTNSHFFVSTVSVAGNSSLSAIQAVPGDSGAPDTALSAPLVDVTQLGNDGLACAGLPAGSLTGKVALIERGTCNFSVKMADAVNAGAVGIVFYMSDSTAPFGPGGLGSFNQLAVMVANSDGLSLKRLVDSQSSTPVTINPLLEKSTSAFNAVAGFSSAGPAIGSYGIKPDLLATGTQMYMGAQSFDPLGGLYSPSGYTVASGTSFSTPLIAGAAALVKQNHPGYSAAQVRSVLINSAAQDVVTDDSGSAVGILQTGPGRLVADLAIQANISFDPPSISFGSIVAGAIPPPRQLQITNNGTSAAALTLSIPQTGQTGTTTVSLDKTTLNLAPGASGTVTLTLPGSVPSPGLYSGAIAVAGGTVPMRVPYMYLVGSGVPANLTPLTGDGDDGTVGQVIPDGQISFKLTDSNGVPVTGAPVVFTPRNGVTLSQASATTDNYGIAQATATVGPRAGNYSILAAAGGITWQFTGSARQAPAITPAGVVDAAAYSTQITPGSYITIFGSGLSDVTDQESTTRLPLALDFVQVSFDVPSAGISVPGRIVYVSPGQVVLQVPWELQGQTSAQVKVTIDFSYGNVVTMPIAGYAPAFFQVAGVVAATDPGGKVITNANPAVRGQTISLYANGLGPVNNQPPSGEPAPSSPLATTTTTPAVTIGGQSAPVVFSGLTPGLPGLYQINATVPASLTVGNQPIQVQIGNQTSKASVLPVQ